MRVSWWNAASPIERWGVIGVLFTILSVIVAVLAWVLPQSPTGTAAAGATRTGAALPIGTGSSAAASSGAGKVYLSTLTPAQNAYAAVVAGPVQFGATTYPESVRWTCEGGQSVVTYTVAGYAFLDATLDVPNDATNATGHKATVSFLKNGTKTLLAQPFTVVLGDAQPVRLDLQGASQVAVSCVATDAGGGYSGMDIALGNAALEGS